MANLGLSLHGLVRVKNFSSPQRRPPPMAPPGWLPTESCRRRPNTVFKRRSSAGHTNSYVARGLPYSYSLELLGMRGDASERPRRNSKATRVYVGRLKLQIAWTIKKGLSKQLPIPVFRSNVKNCKSSHVFIIANGKSSPSHSAKSHRSQFVCLSMCR